MLPRDELAVRIEPGLQRVHVHRPPPEAREELALDGDALEPLRVDGLGRLRHDLRHRDQHASSDFVLLSNDPVIVIEATKLPGKGESVLGKISRLG